MGSWNSLISFLQKLPRLKSLKIHCAKQIAGVAHQFYHVGFKASADLDIEKLGVEDLDPTVSHKSTSRHSMNDWLIDLNHRLVVQDQHFLVRDSKRIKKALALSDNTSDHTSDLDYSGSDEDFHNTVYGYDDVSNDTFHSESDEELWGLFA
jgi:hypothetical protein